MATYTTLTEEIVIQLLRHYEVGTLVKFSLMDGGLANTSCIVVTTQGQYVLSVCDEKSETEVRSLTELLDYLNRNDFFTSRLVPVKTGGGYCFHEGKPVYLKAYIDGEMGGDPSVKKVEQVGEALATLHTIAVPDFIPRDLSLGVGAFAELFERGEYGRWLEGKRNLISPCLTDDLPQGLIHADLFWDNLLFKGDVLVAMLDFEEACHSHLVFDLGMCAAGCCCRDSELDMDLTAALVRGYQRVRTLSEKERSSLRIFIVYAATVTSFWRYRQFNIVHPDPAKEGHYLEMNRLADSLEDMDDSQFNDVY